MTEMEEKSFKAQIKLYDEILSADRMIMQYIQEKAQQIRKVIEDNARKSDDYSLNLSKEESQKMYSDLSNLTSEDGFCDINSHIKSYYIEPRKTKIEILNLLK